MANTNGTAIPAASMAATAGITAKLRSNKRGWGKSGDDDDDDDPELHSTSRSRVRAWFFLWLRTRPHLRSMENNNANNETAGRGVSTTTAALTNGARVAPPQAGFSQRELLLRMCTPGVPARAAIPASTKAPA